MTGDAKEVLELDGMWLLPVRAICEKAGLEVLWDNSLNAVSVGTIPMGVTFNIGENSYYSEGVTKKLSQPVELKYDRSFISAKDAADIVGKKLQITKTDLIIFSDSEQFYDEKENAFDVCAAGMHRAACILRKCDGGAPTRAQDRRGALGAHWSGDAGL